MNPEIEEIFLEALDLLGEERERFLETACNSRPTLRAEVDRLLLLAGKAEDFFGESSTVMGHLAHRRSFGVEKLGDQIGNYRLVERLGEGGFGVVWRASQTHPLKREVAVKVIKAGMDTREVLVRFEGEREALSRLDHPGIARVLDAGETESGRPYVVIELVCGEPVTRFCDAAALPLRERLTLFVEICKAVSHAHQKGVIHRDIKPSNVLVTPESQVKVIDFGIAKAVEGKLTEQTMMTIGNQLMGTPAYMSPEQVSDGLNLDTRTDIYALGTLLYEMLVGVTPFDPKKLTARGQEEMRRMILEKDPPRPSRRFAELDREKQLSLAQVRATTPEGVRSFTSSDLDWIVMKALEKSPDRRYATADALSQDILRFLAHQPVTARAPGRAYLLSKFFRRNRTATLLTLGVAGILLAATAVSIRQAVRAKKAEKHATALLRDSEGVSALLIDVFRLPDPETNGRNITLAEALKSASLKLDQTTGLQPGRKALLQCSLASSYEGLGLYPEAIALLRKALITDESVLGPNHPLTLDVMARLRRMLFDCGYYGDACELAGSEVQRRKNAGMGDDPKTKEAQRILRESAIFSGKAVRPPEPPPAPEPSPTPTPTPEEPKRDISRQQDAIRRHLEEKECSFRALQSSRKPDDPEVLKAMSELAEAYLSYEYRSDAARVQEELFALMRAKYGDTHHKTLHSQNILSYYLWRAGKFESSRKLRAQTIGSLEKVYGPEQFMALENQAWLIEQRYHATDTKGSIELARQVIPVLERIEGPRDRRTLNAKSWLARSLLTEGQTKEAWEILEEIAPLMTDDTYVNLSLANLELWFGQREKYELTRSRMLDYCIRNRGEMINRADLLERAMLLCSLTPPANATQREELLKTLNRCREIRNASNAPSISEPGEATRHFAEGIVLLRGEKYEEAIPALGEARKPEASTGKTPPEAPIAALLQELCRNRLGKKSDELPSLLAATREQLGTPASEQDPLLGRRTTDSWHLTRWNLLREAEHLLKPD